MKLRWLFAQFDARTHHALLSAVEIVQAMTFRFYNYRLLDLNECRGVGADSLAYAVTGLKHLHSLNLSGMGEVNDALLTEAALALPLREVTLSRWVLNITMLTLG